MKAKNMIGNQSGFTLIEIIAVLIIIGILAAVAVPKYFDLTTEAEESAVQAQAANLRAAGTMNFAKYKLNGDYEDVSGCGDITQNLVEDWDDKFSVGETEPSDEPWAQFTLLGTDDETDTCYVELSAD